MLLCNDRKANSAIAGSLMLDSAKDGMTWLIKEEDSQSPLNFDEDYLTL